MDSIKRQASKLREQVARQQQAVLKQFGAGGYGSSDIFPDEAEVRQHQRLEKLYLSTRAAKHFQRAIVRSIDGYIATGSKQVEIGTKLAEDSKKYGVENTCTTASSLSKAAVQFAHARRKIEEEREVMLKIHGRQVAEPLREMVMGSPLEDARHLAQRYNRMRQEAEDQATEVSKRQARVSKSPRIAGFASKLEAAEEKLYELKPNVAKVGKEAAAAMASVEVQQQKMTLQRLITMVESERAYHERVVQILDQLQEEITSERKRIEAGLSPKPDEAMPPPPSHEEDNVAVASEFNGSSSDVVDYFLGEVMHPYLAESDVELSLCVGDYIVVRKVSNSGWAEGECRGKAGWFPLEYIERRDRVLASKMAEVL